MLLGVVALVLSISGLGVRIRGSIVGILRGSLSVVLHSGKIALHLGKVLLALLLGQLTLTLCLVSGQRVFYLRSSFARHVEHHLLISAVDINDYVLRVHHFVEAGIVELLDGHVVGNLHLQVAHAQVVVIKQNNELQRIVWVKLAPRPRLAVVADEIAQ